MVASIDEMKRSSHPRAPQRRDRGSHTDGCQRLEIALDVVEHDVCEIRSVACIVDDLVDRVAPGRDEARDREDLVEMRFVPGVPVLFGDAVGAQG
jgi:hypothetical protein